MPDPLTTWRFDALSSGLAIVLLAGYLWSARRHDGWPASRTWCLVGGLCLWVGLRSSWLAVEDHVLFWPLAVQDVLLVGVVPLPLALARPWELLPGRRRPLPPLVGSAVAIGTLAAIYLTPWDEARLRHGELFQLTSVLLVLAGTALLGPLLGEGSAGYGHRVLVAFVDGLLDVLPGLAVLASHGVIAQAWYAHHHAAWAPALPKDEQLGGTAMVALSELVGLPALLVLLVQWVRADTGAAAIVDAQLDELATADPPAIDRPWWETDAGPLTERLHRKG